MISAISPFESLALQGIVYTSSKEASSGHREAPSPLLHSSSDTPCPFILPSGLTPRSFPPNPPLLSTSKLRPPSPLPVAFVQQHPHGLPPLPCLHLLYLPPQRTPHPLQKHLRILLIQLLPLTLPKNSPTPSFHLRDVAHPWYDVEMHVRDYLRCSGTYTSIEILVVMRIHLAPFLVVCRYQERKMNGAWGGKWHRTIILHNIPIPNPIIIDLDPPFPSLKLHHRAHDHSTDDR